MRVMDLDDWPPQSGEAYNPATDRLPLYAEQVTIDEVLAVAKDYVAFSCIFENRTVNYRLRVPDETTKKQLAKILSDNRGKNLRFIASIEIKEAE